MSNADDPTPTPDDSPDLPELDVPRFGWRLPNGGTTAYAQQVEDEGKDESVTRFVLYGGGEVRYHPMLQAAGDVIELRSLSLKNYGKNPVALLEHNQDVVVGTGKAEVSDGRLLWTVTWDTHPSNPAGILVAHQHARKIRRAASIGFLPGKESTFRADLPKAHPFFVDSQEKWASGRYHRKGEMLEGSSVSIPKDPTALQLQSMAASGTEDPIVAAWRLLSETAPRKIAGLLLDAIKHSDEHRDQLLQALGINGLVLQALRSDAAIRTVIESAALGAIPTNPEKPAADADWWKDWS